MSNKGPQIISALLQVIGNSVCKTTWR